eukprot:TRINITY_DN245_c2_g3_i1.p3 TRINITY_DN245_c2_g3~~TRINITY_DN245_c2_g3_i1.p3  ORF type:complete len:275 (+),score=-35.99 TRINITY_DN245_c2_g3_i1:12548-13372(+)
MQNYTVESAPEFNDQAPKLAMLDPQSFLKPEAIEIQALSAQHSVITLHPFERGFGYTLGEALRRVLLSSMMGAAVVGVQIQGVPHEFSSVYGVKEDVVAILLNLKQLAIRLEGKQKVQLRLRKRGIGPVLAGDIETPTGVEIMNPACLIAHITEEDAELSLTLHVALGRGYQLASSLEDTGFEEARLIDMLPLDASFSPVRKVTYAVESTRVGNRTDLDKLIIQLETDGTLDPEEAIRRSATIIQQQLSAFVDLEREEISGTKETQKKYRSYLL